jgi:hypothetical protein
MKYNNIVTTLFLLLSQVLYAPGASALSTFNAGFTLFDPNGQIIVERAGFSFNWDETLNTSTDTAVVNASIGTITPVFGMEWVSHDVKVFGPGSYLFEACLNDGSDACTSPAPLALEVGVDQIRCPHAR